MALAGRSLSENRPVYDISSKGLTRFVRVYALVQRHACVAQLKNLVRVLDVVAYLIVDDSARVDQPGFD